MLNGLDLFSGIGGFTLALRRWVIPVAYCEIDPYCQATLLSRMASGELPTAPIWDDICSFDGENIRDGVDIIYGGFPCQDISVAGRGEGLEGERSGLFFEIIRLIRDIRPQFVFLENVPAITTRDGWRVVKEFTALRYDCRWGMLSAFEVGAPHLRWRWWMLAHTNGAGLEEREEQHHTQRQTIKRSGQKMAYTNQKRCNKRLLQKRREKNEEWQREATAGSDRWATEPNVGRVAHGIPARVDRIKALGNAVVPQCAEEAFKRLMGLK